MLKAMQGQRPTYVSVDMTRKSEHSVSEGIQNQLSVLQDLSINPQLQQSIHTTMVHDSRSRRARTPER